MRKWIVPLLIGVGTPVGCTSWVINHPEKIDQWAKSTRVAADDARWCADNGPGMRDHAARTNEQVAQAKVNYLRTGDKRAADKEIARLRVEVAQAEADAATVERRCK
jgi:hypothetical protein